MVENILFRGTPVFASIANRGNTGFLVMTYCNSSSNISLITIDTTQTTVSELVTCGYNGELFFVTAKKRINVHDVNNNTDTTVNAGNQITWAQSVQKKYIVTPL